MSEPETLFGVLRHSADAKCVGAIEHAVREAPDRDLCRINVLSFAAKHDLDEERTIAAFLHAARLGLFELSWNVLCPGCGGVLESGTTLKTLNREEYACGMCAAGNPPILDEMVEVTFTVSSRVRRIAAHSPDTLPEAEYYRQIFWSSGVDLPETLGASLAAFTIDSIELPPGEKAVLSVQLPNSFVILFDPVTHGAQFIDVKGEPTRERQTLSMVLNKLQTPVGTVELRPGPLRVSLDNQTDRRVLPGLWIAGDHLHDLLGKRRPFLTAKRLLTNQTFRDIYRTDTLYERVGDLVAYDLVRHHFHVLYEVVAAEAGAVVKTIGDAVMATFPTPDRALAAALRMREEMARINAEHNNEDLLLKIGIHEGPCLAVSLNNNQDYFGQTVNMAARVQGLASTRAIIVTKSVVDDPKAAKILENSGLHPTMQHAALRGIGDEMMVYEIP
jgi:class 3 adenylate cyclase